MDDLVFSEGFADVYENPELLKDPVETIADLDAITPAINEIRLVRSYALYYQYSGEEVDGVTEYKWREFSNDFQDYRVGENPEEFSTTASTLPMVKYQRIESESFLRIPIAKQLSNSLLRKLPVPFSLRFLLYHGMIEDSLGNTYPYGASDSYDFNGQLLPGARLNIKWDGPNGLYTQLWKPYLSWWNSRKVITWMIKDPSTLDFTTTYEIQGNNYILKNRSYSIRGDQVQPGECEFFLV